MQIPNYDTTTLFTLVKVEEIFVALLKHHNGNVLICRHNFVCADDEIFREMYSVAYTRYTCETSETQVGIISLDTATKLRYNKLWKIKFRYLSDE